MGLYFVHINLYHKYFVSVSDKSGDERGYNAGQIDRNPPELKVGWRT